MAISKTLSKDRRTSLVKTSGTGNEESPAKKAPLKAKDSILLGDEYTSDGYRAELAEQKRHADKKRGARGDGIKINKQKLQDASLKPHLDMNMDDKPHIDQHH
jgi:hypothetical protein